MRHEIADGLKALALLGVFMVNGLGYALAPNYPLQLGAPTPLDSALAQAVHALVLTLFMGKALPFLAFLFGYSMALYAKRTAQVSQLKRRHWKLLLVGVLHGTLVYFGDILTAYALIGLWLGSSMALGGRALLRLWRWWASISAVVMGYWLWQTSLDYPSLMPADLANEPATLGLVRTYGQFAALNASAYVPQAIGWLLTYSPLHITLFLTGVLAARYRWLSLKPQLPQLALRPWLYNSWPLALAANGLLAVASVLAHRQYGLAANVNWIALVDVPLGVWLVASCLTRFLLHIQTQQATPKWITWLAPAGRHTLAMYLGLSLVLMLCGRLGLFASEAAWNHTAVWFVALLALWLGAVWIGRVATDKGMRDPVSRWLSR